MNNILFLGGAGFIGSNLVHHFIKSDGDFRIFVFEPFFANIGRIEDIADKITILRGSLSDFDLVESIVETHKINTIVHLVSTLVPGSTYADFKKEFENVVFPTVRIAELCANKNIRFIYFSSGGTVYGNSKGGEKFQETDNLSPISYYGLTKQIIESNILFESRRGNLKYLIVRPSNPFGIGQSLHGKQGFIAVALGKILAGEPIVVWGDGNSTRDYIYIEDLSDAFYKLVVSNINQEIINIGSGYGYSVNDVIERLKKIVNTPFDVKYVGRRNVDVNSMILDISKLSNLIEVRHTHLEDGMRAFYEHVTTVVKLQK